MMWESHSYVGRVCQDTLHNKKIHKQNEVTPIELIHSSSHNSLEELKISKQGNPPVMYG